MIIGSKLNTTPIALLNVSLYSDNLEPADIADYEVRLVTPDEMRLIGNEVPLTATIPRGFGYYKRDENRNITFLGNVVYIVETPSFDAGFRLEHFVAILQAASYFYNKKYSHEILRDWFDYNIDGLYFFMTRIEEYKDIMLGVKLKIDRLFLRKRMFKCLDIKELEKACKKYKIGYNRVANRCTYKNELTFKKVKVGNENEGWINYKFIKLYLNDKLLLMRVVYGFNKFIYDTEWNLLTSSAFHPHIDNHANVCFGNRDEDHNVYTEHFLYNYLVELLNETVRSYHPDSPYINIITLAGSLEVLKKKITSIISLAANKENLDISDYLNYSQSMLRNNIAICPYCHSVLEEPMPPTVNTENPSTCQNITCKASLKYEALCLCRKQLGSVGWVGRHQRYDWRCVNSECNLSTSYTGEEDSDSASDVNPYMLFCRVCETGLEQSGVNNSYVCTNNSCDAVRVYQFTANGGLISGSENSLYNYRARWLQEQEGLTCRDCEETLIWDENRALYVCPNSGDENEHSVYDIHDFAEVIERMFGNFDI